jgi:hypothetical protein
LGLIIALTIAGLQASPGYMDADYYYAGGIQLATGKGLTEPFLWNYLDHPTGLPHPAFMYWMPLASLLAGLGMGLTGKTDYFSARLGFIFLAGLIPVLTAWLGLHLTGRRVTAWTAGGLALFSGFYVIYLALTETFTLYMLLGTAFLVVTAQAWGVPRKAVVLGALAGLMHLARADGVLWLGVGLAVVAWECWTRREARAWRTLAGAIGLGCLGYLAVMGFWLGRNLLLYGSLLPAGNGAALWMVDYDQLYNYPAADLTLQNWLADGWERLLSVRWDALATNLQTALGVQSAVFLFPLILAGLVRLRSSRVARLGAGMWLLTLAIMTLIFPLAGARGGFLHSGAALQPLLWVAAAEGLRGFIDLGVRWRNWKAERASLGFGILVVAVAAVLTLGLAANSLAGGRESKTGWAASWYSYQTVGQTLDRLAIPVDQIVMVNNPPGFFIATGRPAIVIPNGGVDTLRAAAGQYGATYLVLEENTVKDLRQLYQQPQDLPGLKLLETIEKAYLFRIE